MSSNINCWLVSCSVFILLTTLSAYSGAEDVTTGAAAFTTSSIPYRYNRYIFLFFSENATLQYFNETFAKLFELDDYCGGQDYMSFVFLFETLFEDYCVHDCCCSLKERFEIAVSEDNGETDFHKHIPKSNISAGDIDKKDVNNVTGHLLYVLSSAFFDLDLSSGSFRPPINMTQVILITDYATEHLGSEKVSVVLKHLKSLNNITFIALTTNLYNATAHFPNDTWNFFPDYMSWKPNGGINPICNYDRNPYTTLSPPYTGPLTLNIFFFFSSNYIKETHLAGVVELLSQLATRRYSYPCSSYRSIFFEMNHCIKSPTHDRSLEECVADPGFDYKHITCSADRFRQIFGPNVSNVITVDDEQTHGCSSVYEDFMTSFLKESFVTLETNKYLIIADLPMPCVNALVQNLLSNYSFFENGAPLTVIAIDKNGEKSVANSYVPLFPPISKQLANLYQVNDINELLVNINTSINFCHKKFGWHNTEPLPSNMLVWYYYLISAAIIFALITVFAAILLKRKRKRAEVLRQIRERLDIVANVTGTNRYIASHSSERNDIWEVPFQSLDIDYKTFIGKGAFSVVHSGFLHGKAPVVNIFPSITMQKFANCHVAVKTLPQHSDNSSKAIFVHEIELMKEIGYHVHLVSMLGYNCSITRPILLMELAKQDLLHWLAMKRSIAERETNLFKTLLSISWQISDGMTYLASKHFVHRDLAARNVLLTIEMKALVSDFGLCHKLENNEQVLEIRGGRLPLKWMALESLQEKIFSLKTDVWSFGILLFEMFTLGQEPYMGMESEELIPFLERGKRLDKPEQASDQIYELMCKCWQAKPSKRPEFSEIRPHFVEMLENSTAEYGYLLPTEQEL